MFDYHNKCIFCDQVLPDSPSGNGEHVIPEIIFGFWRIYDVCGKCKQHFGNCIDCLAIQNPDILNALDALSLRDTSKYNGLIPFVGEDTIDKHTVPMIKKGDNFKAKVNYPDDNLLECAEDDWEKIGIAWIRQNASPSIPRMLLDDEIERLKTEYKDAQQNISITSSLLGITIRKRQVTNVKMDLDRLPNISPLISKIAVCFLSYALSATQLATIADFEMLQRNARFGEPLRPYMINHCLLRIDTSCHRFHRIRLETIKNFLRLDMTFFGYPNWCVLLKSDEPILVRDMHNNPCDGISLVLDFENLQERKKYLGFKKIDSEKFLFYELSA